MTAATTFFPNGKPWLAQPEPAKAAHREETFEQQFDSLAIGGCSSFRSAGQEIRAQGQPADRVFRIAEGVVRSYRILADGSRQITQFHFPGDIFGLEDGTAYRTGSEAIGNVELVAVRRSVLDLNASRNADFCRWLCRVTIRLQRLSEEHALVLGRQGAVERVSAFLAALRDRLGGCPCFALAMTRQDMADHLGLTIHTVSRTLTELQNLGWIRLIGSRRVLIQQDAQMLAMCA